MTTLEFSHVSRSYKVRGAGTLKALDDVSFTLTSGSTIALVGQSGSGKSTIAKILTQLESATSGEILLDGKPIPRRGRALRRYRQQVRMVFQDPYASLNPYHTIRHHLERPLRLDRVVPSPEVDAEVRSLLERVKLDPALADRHPHELSGGQRQRVAIARALASRPSLLIADEPVSMLDVSIKWDIVRLLKRLARDRGIAMLYITHDLATVGAVCDRLAIMYRGRIVETGPVEEVLSAPRDA